MKMNFRTILLVAAAFCLPGLRASETTGQMPTTDAALARLKSGNARFVEGRALHAGQDAQRREETTKAQHPYVVVLTCADSRVAPEILFDEGIGDLFVIRNAGNLSDPHVLGSIEYAVEHLHTPLVVVLGHGKCGAVSAAVAGGEAPGHILSIVEDLRGVVAEAVARTAEAGGNTIDVAVRLNAQHVAKAIAEAPPILDVAVKAGHLRVVAARYDLGTGEVEFLE